MESTNLQSVRCETGGLDDVVGLADTVLIQGQNIYPPLIGALIWSGYYGEKIELLKKLLAYIPTKSPHTYSAEVIFDGSVDWIVLLKSRPQNPQAEKMGLEK